MGSSSSTLSKNSPAQLRAASLPFSRSAGKLARRFAIPAIVFVLPLIVWPGLAQPFSTPKLIAWCVAAAGAAVVCSPAARRRLAEAPAAPLVSLSVLIACLGISAATAASADLASLLLPVTAIAWFVALQIAQPDERRMATALAASASLIAFIALLQFAGFDAFRGAGWAAVGGGNARMRIYSTLGNPNFVGAFLAGALPLTIALARNAARGKLLLVAVLVQALGIIATGSRAAAIGALIGVAVALVDSWFRRKWLAAVLAIAVAGLAIGFSPARPLTETLDGRLYVWRVAAPHLSAIPVFGHGPGALESQFQNWQRQHFLSQAGALDAHFAAGFDHAHNDLLEWAIEFGWAGLAALLLCAAIFFAVAWRVARNDALRRGALAGVCALAVISLADFPLHRPAELFLLVTLMAVSLGPRGCDPESKSSL